MAARYVSLTKGTCNRDVVFEHPPQPPYRITEFQMISPWSHDPVDLQELADAAALSDAVTKMS